MSGASPGPAAAGPGASPAGAGSAAPRPRIAAPGEGSRLPHRWLVRALSGGRWAAAELDRLRPELKADALGAGATIAPPPTNARGSLRGARIALRLRRASCLERSLIIQAWFAAVGVPTEVIIGVRNPGAPGRGATAHAWIDGFDADCSDRYAEIRRVRS